MRQNNPNLTAARILQAKFLLVFAALLCVISPVIAQTPPDIASHQAPNLRPDTQPSLPHSPSLLPIKTTTLALQIANRIDRENLTASKKLLPDKVKLQNLSTEERLKTLRILAMDSLFFRNNFSTAKMIDNYKIEANLQNSPRDIKIARIFVIQQKLMNANMSLHSNKQLFSQLQEYWDDPDWFVAQRAALMQATLQTYNRQFDVGLNEVQAALNKIPNKLGPDYDEARYETYDLISYFQLILNNLEDGVGTTQLVIQIGLDSGRQIDGMSLLNNLAYAFNNWNEFATSEKIAEILFRISNKSESSKSSLAYYRYAQAQNNAENYTGALKTTAAGLNFAKIPARQIGLISERAVALAGLGNVKASKAQFRKFDNLVKTHDLKANGYDEVRLRARILVAIAEGDIILATNLQKSRSKTIVQRMLRFQSNNIQGMHAALENDKARQQERANSLKREAEIARKEAVANLKVAYLMAALAVALFIILLCGITIAKLKKQLAQTMESGKYASEAGERSKQNFLSVMSHEFRTPLNGIIGISDLLSQNAPSESLRRQNKIILESGESLLGLLTGILDMTYLESGDLTVYSEIGDIKQITENVYKKWIEKIDPTQVTFTMGIADDVPKELMLDINRISTALDNLVSNAVKFTKSGRIHIHVTMLNFGPNDTRNPRDPKHVRKLSIIVADTGIGISDEMEAKLFKPFVQADSSMTRDFGGAGIGLAVTRGFARVMGGDILVNSTFGQGSEFSMYVKTIEAHLAKKDPNTGMPVFDFVPDNEHGITFSPAISMKELEAHRRKEKQKRKLKKGHSINGQVRHKKQGVPLVEKRTEHAGLLIEQSDELNHRGIFSRKAPRQDGAPIAVDKLDGLNVLIVEDILANQEIIRSILEPVGCQVITATHGLEAINEMEKQIFDVILMDIRMPVMNGIETTRHIRNTADVHQDVPIIALTADASAENNAECLAVGADVFLTKPVIVSELLSSIRYVREKKSRITQTKLSA